MKEKKRRSVLQSDGDGMRRPPGHLITGAGREEVLRKGGGEETRSVRCMCDVCGEDPVAASKQFRRSRGEKSTRLGLVALTVRPVHSHMRASKERASEGAYVGAQSLQHAISSEDRAGRRALGSGWLR